MTMTDTELHDKIKTFITKLDRMESRVREVETVAAKIPKMEATLSRISSRVETFEQKSPSVASPQKENFEGEPLSRGQAMFRGVALGLVIVGIILAAAWALGLF